jgi:hypothetical protein
MLARTEVKLLLAAMGGYAAFTLYKGAIRHRANTESHSGLIGGPSPITPESLATKSHSSLPLNELIKDIKSSSPIPRSSPLAAPVPARPLQNKAVTSSTPSTATSSVKSSTPSALDLDSLTPSESVVRDAMRLASFAQSEREALVGRNGSLSVAQLWEVLDDVVKATDDHAQEVKAQLEHHMSKAEEESSFQKKEILPSAFDLNVFLPATLETSHTTRSSLASVHTQKELE